MAEIIDRLKKGAGFLLDNPEGLATGALGGFLFGGPVGLALGIGQGILAKRLRQSELDAYAEDQERLAGYDQDFQRAYELANSESATDFDRAQLEQLVVQRNAQRRAALSTDPEVRAKAFGNLEEQHGAVSEWLEDIEGRREVAFDRDVGTLDSEATNARERYETGLTAAQDTQRVGEEIHRILNSGADVNSGPVRARLAALMGTSPKEILADPNEMVDAWAALGAAAGPVGAAIGEYFKGKADAEDFNFSKEDWRNVAHAMTLSGQNMGQRRAADAQQFGQLLDERAGGIGHKPALSYLERIMTGKVQDSETVSGRPGAYGGAQGDAPAEPKTAGNVDEPRPGGGLVNAVKQFGDVRSPGDAATVTGRSIKELATGGLKFGAGLAGWKFGEEAEAARAEAAAAGKQTEAAAKAEFEKSRTRRRGRIIRPTNE